MTDYVIEQAPVPVLPVVGSEGVFPVRRIYCVGRNYAAHAREMGGDPTREAPFFFCKPADAVVPVRPGTLGELIYPSATQDLHHEVELVVAIGRGGADIPVEQALDHVWGYTVGLDMTRRDLQGEAKDLRRPWEVGKAFEHSAPCGDIVPAASLGHPASGAIWLDVDGERKQTGDLNQMIWKTPEIIASLSGLFVLAPGDLIFSGTPAGVGAVQRGQTMLVHIDGVGELSVRVV